MKTKKPNTPKNTRRSQKKDLEKLSNAFYSNLEIIPYEFGGIGLDPKRPFGNSSVPEQILQIIGWNPEIPGEDSENEYSDRQIDYAVHLYKDKLIPYLKYQWKRRTKTHNTAMNEVSKEISRQNYLGKKAVKFCDSMFDCLDKSVFEFVENVRELMYSWKREKDR